MAIYDMHSHWGTRRGYTLRTEAELAQQKNTWNSEPKYATEEEQADYFRKSNVRVVLDFGFDKYLPMSEAAELHDYGFETQRKYSDVILGNWVHINPRTGPEGVRELRRCRDANAGFLGFAVSGSGSGPATDPIWLPFYKLCIEAKIPVLIFVGTTGSGAGLAGRRRHPARPLPPAPPRRGGGALSRAHHRGGAPRLAVAGRDDRGAAAQAQHLVRAARLVAEVPHPRSQARDSRRLKTRMMFGADYPLFTYERLVGEWKAEGYSDEVLDRVFTKNAEAFFAAYNSGR